jgi:hypothetical protein
MSEARPCLSSARAPKTTGPLDRGMPARPPPQRRHIASRTASSDLDADTKIGPRTGVGARCVRRSSGKSLGIGVRSPVAIFEHRRPDSPLQAYQSRTPSTNAALSRRVPYRMPGRGASPQRTIALLAAGNGNQPIINTIPAFAGCRGDTMAITLGMAPHGAVVVLRIRYRCCF